jgi:hypothetical protein
VSGQVGTAFDAKLHIDLLQMIVDCSYGHKESVRDLSAGQILRGQERHLTLSAGQLGAFT